MSKLLEKIEVFFRGICMYYSLFIICILIIFDSFLHPIYRVINKLSGQYFSRNFNLSSPGEYGVRHWSQLFFHILGITLTQEIKVELPKSKKENILLMFTHGSNMDSLIYHTTFPYFPCFVAKKELFKVPIFGRLMKVIGQVPIDRENLASAIESLKLTANIALTENRNVAIAPEGTRRRAHSTGPDQLLPFKKGPFHLAKAIGVDIIPTVIIGANRLWPPGKIVPASGNVIVKYLERIPKEFVQKSTLEELQAEVKRRYVQNLEPISDKVILNRDGRPFGLFLLCLAVFFANCIFLYRLFTETAVNNASLN